MARTARQPNGACQKEPLPAFLSNGSSYFLVRTWCMARTARQPNHTSLKVAAPIRVDLKFFSIQVRNDF
jgi:hypothetical protein